MVIQMLKAKCAWLKHDWNMTGSVRLMRQLTAQDVPVKQGRALSLPLMRARAARLFIYEYQVEECNAEPLVPVISSSCKSSISPTTHIHSHRHTDTQTHTHTLPFSLASPLLHRGLEQSNRIGQSWHHRFFASASLSGSWVWCNWFNLNQQEVHKQHICLSVGVCYPLFLCSEITLWSCSKFEVENRTFCFSFPMWPQVQTVKLHTPPSWWAYWYIKRFPNNNSSMLI